MSYTLFLEIAISLVPFFMHINSPLSSFHFALFKLPRYGRLFEMDESISSIIEKQAETKTKYEI
jgi:hypothetical protein